MKIPRPWLHAARLADLVLFYPAVVVVIWGELTGSEPQLIQGSNDKLLHFIAYFGLAAMAALGFRRRQWVALASLGLIVLGGVLEIVQGFIGRDMSLFDEATNTVGVIVGAFAGRIIIEALRRRWIRH
jgi:VanZ family protein